MARWFNNKTSTDVQLMPFTFGGQPGSWTRERWVPAHSHTQLDQGVAVWHIMDGDHPIAIFDRYQRRDFTILDQAYKLSSSAGRWITLEYNPQAMARQIAYRVLQQF